MLIDFFSSISWFLITFSIAFFYLLFKNQINNYLLNFKKTKNLSARQLQDTSIFRKKALLYALLITFGLYYFLDMSIFLCTIIFSVLLLIIPAYLIKKSKEKLFKAFDKALVDGLLSLSSSLKAGLTIQGGLEVATKSTEPIFAEQAERVLRDYQLGVRIDEALERVRLRIPTDNCNMAFGALIIGRQIGGPLPLILSRISDTIRERDRVEGRLNALTAQGKGQAKLIFSLPILIGLWTAYAFPERWTLMTTNIVGEILLYICVILWVIGLFVTIKMLKLDI